MRGKTLTDMKSYKKVKLMAKATMKASIGLFISLAHSRKTSIIFPELSVSCNVIQM
jgi:hypothetical protein